MSDTQPTRMERMTERWMGPTGVAIIAGGIIWGIQLNYATMNLTSQVARITKDVEIHDSQLDEVSANLLRTTIVLQNMEEEMSEAVGIVKEHNDASEEWKRRIILLEATIDPPGYGVIKQQNHDDGGP